VPRNEQHRDEGRSLCRRHHRRWSLA
jgi:hypothetical protein